MLLELLGLSPAVIPPHVDETVRPGEDPSASVLRIACEKAHEVANRLKVPADAVVAGDTIVVCDGIILGKPCDRNEARRMLQSLSGRSHEVLTGYCVLSPANGGGQQQGVVRTIVRFKPLSPPEMSAYIETGEPLDKAGAYGIQGRAAGMVEAIEGSYTNVVGLPLTEIQSALESVTGHPLFYNELSPA